MARPRKQEVDYFPHYCDHGKVLFILENRFKNDGYAVFYKLEELLAKTEGHCYDCSSLENWEYLLSKMGTTEETVVAIIEKLVSMKVIDPDLWAEKRLWMQTFVDSIADAYSRRKIAVPAKPAVTAAQATQDVPLDGINDDIYPPDIPLSGIKDDIYPQSKIKKSKVNKRKEERESLPPPPQQKIIDAYHEILPMLPQVREWSKTRQGHLNVCLQDKSRQSLAWWKDYFGRVRDSPFLLGQNHRGWRADLEWLTKKSNLIKVLEEKYDGGGSNGGSRQNAIGRSSGPAIGAASVAKSDSAPYPVDHIF